MRREVALGALLCLTVATTSTATIRTQEVEYRHGDTVLQGYLAYDDYYTGRRPGVLVVHEWWGLNDYARMRTEKLAELGYVAFAADIYGKGKRADDARAAGHLAGVYLKDRELLRARALAGVDVLRRHELVDPGSLGAIGFCFGGTTVLELARGGADLRGVVSFHGGLKTPTPAQAGAIRSRILVLHGAEDPFVPQEDVLAFQEEMRASGADWQMLLLGGALHSFSNPEADGGLEGALYNEKAARRSWEAMEVFFRDTLR